jgi:hypothetical protein
LVDHANFHSCSHAERKLRAAETSLAGAEQQAADPPSPSSRRSGDWTSMSERPVPWRLFEEVVMHEIRHSERRRVYVHLARGTLTASGTRLGAGDALMLRDTKRLDLAEADDADVFWCSICPDGDLY